MVQTSASHQGVPGSNPIATQKSCKVWHFSIMKKLWDLNKVFSSLELEGKGGGIIMGVTRLFLPWPFYTILTKKTLCTYCTSRVLRQWWLNLKVQSMAGISLAIMYEWKNKNFEIYTFCINKTHQAEAWWYCILLITKNKQTVRQSQQGDLIMKEPGQTMTNFCPQKIDVWQKRS